jgi:5'(3')-deoxyribonucleotidase
MVTKKKTIAIDFDDVLYDAEVVARSLIEHGIAPESVKTWEMTEVPPEVVSIIRARFHDPAYMCDPAGMIPEAVKAVKRIAWLGYRVIVISSRAADIAEQTKEIVKKLMPCVDEVFIVGLGGDKTKIMKEQEVVLLIDDGPHNIEAAMKAGIPCTLISNIRTNHNKKLAKKLKRRKASRLVAPSLATVAAWLESMTRNTLTDYEVRKSLEG